MADANLDAIQWEFAELTGLLEDAALIASEGQRVNSLDGAHRRSRRLSTTMQRIRRRIIILEGRLQ